MTSLPLSSASYDVVIALHVLEHVIDDHAAMKELARVVRSNGVVVLQVPLGDSDASDEDPGAATTERIRRFGQPDHLRLYGRLDFERRLRAAGFKDIWRWPTPNCLPRTRRARLGIPSDEFLHLATTGPMPQAFGLLHAERLPPE